MKFFPLAVMALASLATSSNAIPAQLDDGAIHFPLANLIQPSAEPSLSSLAAKRAPDSDLQPSLWHLLTGQRRRAVPSDRSLNAQRSFSFLKQRGVDNRNAKGKKNRKTKNGGTCKIKHGGNNSTTTTNPDGNGKDNGKNNSKDNDKGNGNGKGDGNVKGGGGQHQNNNNNNNNNNNSTSGPGRNTNKVMAGYWPDWTANALPPEKINFSKFDIVNYAFALPTQDQNLFFPVDDTRSLLKRLVTAAHSANSKVVLAIGGWGGSTYFSPSVATADTRSRFIGNIKKVYDQYKLDGIDLDWEYPGQSAQGSLYDPRDAANFQTFITELRSALPKGAIISAAVTHNPWIGSNGQPVKSVERAASALDYILIMNYDVWGSSSNPGPNAPLADLCGNSTQPHANAAAGVKQWTAAGMPSSKILMGVPSYGYINTSSKKQLRQRSIITSQPESHPQSDVPSGKVGRYDARYISKRAATLTTDDGSTGSGQINFKSLIKQGALKKGSDGQYVAGDGFTRYWDKCSDTPFLANGKLVVTYDDTSSISDKASFAKKAGIAGLSMWSIDGDSSDGDLVNAAIAGMSS